ncbi:MAG: MgtC/SapB family protein [Clostridia bacterium]|nr:MgtC/SapB family protein [Clostridia bacterium]
MDWYVVVFRIALAIVVGLSVGIEREYKNRPAGMRTHVLVCMGACIVSLTECIFAAGMSDADGNITYNFGRLAAQVISGVGFLGAGTIFTASKKITGLTTAASLWSVACLGLTIGYGLYLVALVGGALVLIVLMTMQKIVHVNSAKKVEVKFVHRVETIDYINEYFSRHFIQTLDIDFTVETHEDRNIYTNIYTLHLPPEVKFTDLVNDLSEHPNVMSIRTTHA